MIRYPFHQGSQFFYWLTCATCIAIGGGALFFWRRTGDAVLVAFGLLFMAVAVGMFFHSETIVKANSTVERRTRLFGIFPVHSRVYPASDFKSVIVHNFRRASVQGEPDTCKVFLRRRSGRPLFIQYFNANVNGESSAAEKLAKRLAADLNLTIEEKEV